MHDGFALEKSTVRSPLGGALLNRAMKASITKKGVLIRPHLSFKRVEKAPGQWEVRRQRQSAMAGPLSDGLPLRKQMRLSVMIACSDTAWARRR